MTTKPQTWHYGLVARWWAEFLVTGPEIPYFQRLIEKHGQPALDVACGTGRLLLPYLRAGLDVDGCDISLDMLALCRERAQREGLSPRLHEQAMHELDLPRTYKTIYICGSFGLGGDRQQDIEALRRCYRHLDPGGALVLDDHLPYAHRSWKYWLKENRDDLPEPWPHSGDRRLAADGAEYELRARIVGLDSLEQLVTSEIRVGLWRNGQLVVEEEHNLQSHSYFKNELLMMLEKAGFGDVKVQGDYTEAEATAEHDILVFIATK